MTYDITSVRMIAFRTNQGLTQTQLAELLGYTKQAVNYWESGKRPIPMVVKKAINLFRTYPQLMKEF